MRYGIIGTGAIGGYYGAKLAHAGQEVHFLLHSDYEYVKQHGLQVDSCDGSFHLSDVSAYQSRGRATVPGGRFRFRNPLSTFVSEIY